MGDIGYNDTINLYDLYPLWYTLSRMEAIGQKVQSLRKKTRLTQMEFAKRVGVGLRFVRDLEQGKSSVRLDKVNQVLEFLGHHLEIISDHERRQDIPKSNGSL